MLVKKIVLPKGHCLKCKVCGQIMTMAHFVKVSTGKWMIDDKPRTVSFHCIFPFIKIAIKFALKQCFPLVIKL